MSKSTQTLGLVFILIGIIGFLSNFFDFSFFNMAKLWPIFLLIPGLAFELIYFSNHKSPGLLVPGGILITLGIIFLFQTYTNWIFAGFMWPFYVLAPAIGLFQLYLFGTHNYNLLIPVGILTTVAVVGVLSNMYSFINASYIWPIALIVVGFIILLGRNGHDSNSSNHSSSK